MRPIQYFDALGNFLSKHVPYLLKVRAGKTYWGALAHAGGQHNTIDALADKQLCTLKHLFTGAAAAGYKPNDFNGPGFSKSSLTCQCDLKISIAGAYVLGLLTANNSCFHHFKIPFRLPCARRTRQPFSLQPNPARQSFIRFIQPIAHFIATGFSNAGAA